MGTGRDLDVEIASYEKLMHRVLQDYHTKKKITILKKDYDDFMQEMRITVWEVLTNDDPETMFLKNKDTQFSTYLYMVLSNRIKDLLKTQYGIKLTSKKYRKELTVTDSLKQEILNPKHMDDLSFDQQILALQSSEDSESIRLSIDIDSFVKTLNPIEKEIWNLKLENRSIAEITKILKEKRITDKDRTTISKYLKKLLKSFTNFMNDGE